MFATKCFEFQKHSGPRYSQTNFVAQWVPKQLLHKRKTTFTLFFFESTVLRCFHSLNDRVHKRHKAGAPVSPLIFVAKNDEDEKYCQASDEAVPMWPCLKWRLISEKEKKTGIVKIYRFLEWKSQHSDRQNLASRLDLKAASWWSAKGYAIQSEIVIFWSLCDFCFDYIRIPSWRDWSGAEKHDANGCST